MVLLNMSDILRYILTLVLSLSFITDVHGQKYFMNAVILGYKDDIDIDKYRAAADVLHNGDSHCKVIFEALEYDTANGSAVYRSLENARYKFDSMLTTVAVGPFIDVFTSMDYVIRKQIHLVTAKTDTMEASSRALPVLPDSKSMSESVAEIIRELKWAKVAFLSQDDFSPVLELSRNGIFVWPIRLPGNITGSNDTKLINNLKTLREAHMDKFLLHSMRKDVVQNVILAAEDLHLLHHSLSWFITYLDFNDIWNGLETMPAAGATISGLQLLNKAAVPKQLIDKYPTMSRLEIGLLVDVVEMLYHHLDKWSSCTTGRPPNNEDKFMDASILQDNVNTQANRYVGALGKYAWKNINGVKGLARTEYTMDIIQYKEKMLKKVGNCSVSDSLDVTMLNIPPPKTRVMAELLRDNEFDVIAKEEAPFIMRKPGRPGEFDGFCYQILEELSKMLNFKFNLVVKDTDTKWDSIIEELQSGKYDIAIGSLVVKADRERKITFSHTVLSSSVSILLKKPPRAPTYFQFLWPFTKELWLMILLFFFVVGFSLYVMARYDTTQADVDQKFDFKESMWYSLNVLLQGGTDYSPQTMSMRTIVAFFWFCTLIITAAYTANLAAYLTLQQIDNRIKTVDNLSKQANVKYGVRNGTELMDFFEKARMDPYERMWAFMTLKNTIVSNIYEGIEKVKNEDEPFAYLDDGKINEYFAMQHCTLESFDQDFGDKQYSIGFPKGAPYKDDINRALLKLKEDGLLDQFKQRWWSPAPNCSAEDTSRKEKSSAELELKNMFGVFFILAACVVAAIVFEIVKKVYLALCKTDKDKKEKEMVEPSAI